MQLFAFDHQKHPISATFARKHHDYFCMECGEKVRLRGGFHTQKHFFHLNPRTSCQQSQKSLTHLQIQRRIIEKFQEGECEMEKRFPQINRIADVVWFPKKIIFEVQCSGISAREVQQRNHDYGSLGYQVVWILHEKRFNKWNVSAAEKWLQTSPHYFTNMDAKGRGIFYDQLDVVHRGIRQPHKEINLIDLAQPKIVVGSLEKMIAPRKLVKRIESWPLHFSGDFLDKALTEPILMTERFAPLLDLESALYPSEKNSWWKWTRLLCYRLVIRPYFIGFQIILEKACK